jgi:hypothetical protein
MEIKVTTLKQLLEDVPQEVIEKALKQAADETLKRVMARNWERQRFHYIWPMKFELRSSLRFKESKGDE